ncbi:MAG: hypothetical protein LAT76_11725 [Schleiferiaceae bacterium]|nr:hypothetical protein [Schleiferiaceae bacterium]
MENRTINIAVVAKARQYVIQKGILQEVVLAHILPLLLEQRLPIVAEKINQIINQPYGL